MLLSEKKTVATKTLKSLYDQLCTEVADVLAAREYRHILSDSDFCKRIQIEHNLMSEEFDLILSTYHKKTLEKILSILDVG